MVDANNILLPYNFSVAAGQAVPYALDLAAQTGAALHTLSVDVLRGNFPLSSSTREAILDDVRGRFDEALVTNAGGRYGRDDVQFVHASRRNIEATSAILRYATAQDIDVIVMGTHGRSGLRRFAVGSVAETIVRKAPCPVLTVRRAGESAPSERWALQRILVPTDFSKRSREALSRAKAIAAHFGAEIDLFHAVEETLPPAFYGPTIQSIYDAQPNIEDKVTARLKKLYRTTEGRGGEVTFSTKSGDASKAIAEHADASGADLIVMATHGRTGLARVAALGSVAETVVRTAPCPVLTARRFHASPVGASADAAPSAGDGHSKAVPGRPRPSGTVSEPSSTSRESLPRSPR